MYRVIRVCITVVYINSVLWASPIDALTAFIMVYGMSEICYIYIHGIHLFEFLQVASNIANTLPEYIPLAKVISIYRGIRDSYRLVIVDVASLGSSI